MNEIGLARRNSHVLREVGHAAQSVQNDSLVAMVAVAHAALRWS
jgi:hypothetical protein